jgi:LacI family transcriptional regulator
MNQTTPSDPRVRYLAEHNFPFATHGRTEMGLDHPYFDFDNEEFARIGVRELKARGRKRLILVPPPRAQSYARHMITGFADEAAAQGLTFEVMEDVTSDSGASLVEAAFARRMAAEPAVDGILSGSTTSAMAAVAGAEQVGRVIGHDFDIVAKEAITFLRRFRREIIVVEENVGRAGNFLARAVMAAIERRAPEQGQFLDRPDHIEA